MGILFNEFEEKPTPTFYALLLLFIGLLFLGGYKYFSNVNDKYKCSLTLKNPDEGGACFDKNKKILPNTNTSHQCCNENGVKNKNTWQDVSYLKQDCTGNWIDMYAGRCVENSNGMNITCNNPGFTYKQFNMIKPAKFGGECPFVDGEMRASPCVRTCVSSDCSPTDNNPVCDGSGRVIGFNECFARAAGFTSFEPCANPVHSNDIKPTTPKPSERPSGVVSTEHCLGPNNSVGLEVCDKNNNKVAINSCVALETVEDYTGFDGVNYKFCHPTHVCTKEYNPMCDKNNKVIASNKCVAGTLGYKVDLLKSCNGMQRPITKPDTPVGIDPVPEDPPVGVYPVPEDSPVGIDPVPEDPPVGIDPIPEDPPVGIDPIPYEEIPVPDECNDNTKLNYDPVCDLFGRNIFIAVNKCVARQAGYTDFAPCTKKFGNAVCTFEHDPVCDENNNILGSNPCIAKKNGHHPDSFQTCQ